MDTTLKNARVEDLLLHADWLRGLAARLVGGSDADDVVQEAWVAALRSPPAGSAAEAQPWLARVVRNLAVSRFRARRVRADSARDLAAASGASVTPEALLERARLQRQLAELVAALDEPLRTVVLLRHYEGKSGAEIARALGVPAGTVRWRLHEATTQLRERLDERHGGDRARWRALLLPLVLPRTGPTAPPAATAASRLVTPTSIAVLAGSLLVVAVVVLGGQLGKADRQETKGLTSAARAPASEGPRPLHLLHFDPTDAPASVAGRVLDPGGQPVAGARVVALLETEAGREAADLAGRLRPAATTLSAADGRFHLGPLAPGSYALGATAPGLSAGARPQLLALPGEPLGGIDVTLGTDGLLVKGSVFDEGGGPLAGARVQAVTLPVEGETAQLFEVMTDQAGAYSILLAPASYLVTALTAGYAPSSTPVVVGAPRTHHFRLSPAGTVRGRVVVGEGASAAARALVTALPWGGSQGERDAFHVEADGEGRFELRDLPPGQYRFSARGEAGLGQSPRAVTVVAGPREGELTIALLPAATISGRVHGDDGRPLPGARLRLLEGQRWRALATPLARAAADGRYRFFAVRPGHYVLLAELPGHAPARHDLVVKGDEAQDIPVRLRRGGSVEGVVRDRKGAPIAGAVVTLDTTEPEQPVLFDRPFLAVRSGADGRFALQGLGEGTLKINARHPAHMDGALPGLAMARGQHQQVELRLDPRGQGSIAGVVRRQGGAVAEGRVVAGWREARGFAVASAPIGADGRFRIGPLPPGRITVVASARPSGALLMDAGAPHAAAVDLGEGQTVTDLALTLPDRDLRITGRIVSPQGTPLEGAQVTAQPLPDGAGWVFGEAVPEARTPLDGTFAFDGLEPGRYVLRAVYEGFASEVREEAAGREGLEVKLAATGSIRGLVTAAAGKPAARFTLRALRRHEDSSDEPGREKSVQDQGGAFVIDSLPAGTYEVEAVTSDGRVGRSPPVVVPAGGAAEVKVATTAGVALRVQVVDFDDGSPIPSLAIAVEDGGYTLGRARTDRAGWASIPGLVARAGLRVIVPAEIRPDYVGETIFTAADALPGGAPFLVRLARKNPATWITGPAAGSIGLGFQRQGQRLVVNRVLPDSPAARAGLAVGDELISVDGRSAKNAAPRALIDLIRGVPGTAVTLGVVSSGVSREVTLVRVGVAAAKVAAGQ